jgi:epoxyqueuosine reductase
MSHPDSLTAAVKSLALEAGFARVGIAPADTPPHAERFGQWLGRSWHGEMEYMAANLVKRLQPDRLVEGAKSCICLAVSYAPAPGEADGLVARYARGRDYHKVLKKRCLSLMDAIRRIVGSLTAQAFVDTAPVMERSLAARAGLGWIGRNGCLIVPGLGSYVLLCEIICDLPLDFDRPLGATGVPPVGTTVEHPDDRQDARRTTDDRRDACRTCGACVRACPTGAIGDGGLVDARRCVSYLTVECREPIDPQLWKAIGNGVFGCDRCQEACPHNRSVPPGDAELRGAGPPLGGAAVADILNWTEQDWDLATRGSACRRASRAMFLRNAKIAAGNKDRQTAGPEDRKTKTNE